MKQIGVFLLILVLSSCNQKRSQEIELLQLRIDSLKQQLAESYKPGLGEFMGNIQAHHIKLWYAGTNSNWALAEFETHEIIETVDDIKKFETEHEESQLISMIEPALDSVNVAIKKRDGELFKARYTTLTRTCNECHMAAKFGFNVVKIPDMQPFGNQVFSLKK